MLKLLKPWDSQPQETADINRESWQARDLSLWWPLNGNAFDPVKQNLGTLNSGARFAASSRGLAAFFDGSDDYISWPSTTLGNANNFTFSAWIYYSGSLSARATVYGCENAATTFQLEVGGGAGGPTTGGVTAIYAGNVVGGTGNSILAANTWTHIVYIKRGTGATSEFYINGVQTTTATNNALNYTETASVHTLGRRAAASQLYSGMIQDVRINNFSMSAEQVAQLYRDGLQLFAPRSIWVPVSSSTSGTSHTISPSGGITFAGTSVDVKGKVIAPTGGVTFAGTGSMAFATTGTEYVITPSGGITFTGTGTQVRSKTITPTGGITFSGTGLDLRTKVIDISGGVTFGGTGSMTSNTSVVTGTVGERTKVGVGT